MYDMGALLLAFVDTSRVARQSMRLDHVKGMRLDHVKGMRLDHVKGMRLDHVKSKPAHTIIGEVKGHLGPLVKTKIKGKWLQCTNSEINAFVASNVNSYGINMYTSCDLYVHFIEDVLCCHHHVKSA